MPTSYSQFFLNSGSNIVQLELVELSHPLFSQVYRIVRNAIAGVTVTLEDSTVQTFQYYPVKLTPSGAYNDLDQTLQIQFGDLGQILPMELDRLITQPNTPINQACLIGAWVDGTGQLIAAPFVVGIGGQFYPPVGAVALQLGINDNFMFDNSGNLSVVINGAAPVTVNSICRPWTYVGGGLNNAYPYSPTSSAAPVSIACTPTVLMQITVTGVWAYSGSSGNFNGLGDPTHSGRGAGNPGFYVVATPLPGTYIKPIVKYRTYRSDDLSGPLAGPFAFDIDTCSFQKEGSTFQCSAPRLNLAATGEIYAMDRFPMLRGFL